MSKKPCLVLLLLGVMALLVSCNSTPSHVIPEKKMARLLADMHTGEAVVEMNHYTYSTDSTKQVLKQAILKRHNVTQEQFDTSLVWYAHNIDKYLEVYDMTIADLEGRMANAGVLMAQANMSVAGDSVDIWGGARYAALGPKLPSRMVSFDIAADENCERGDMYTYRVKLIDGDGANLKWTLFANYNDSTTEYVQNSHMTAANGWNEVIFVTDSTKQLTRLRGNFEPVIEGKPVIWVDSISLVRKRLVPEKYNLRGRQRSYKELYM